jgi:hypothetical protein
MNKNIFNLIITIILLSNLVVAVPEIVLITSTEAYSGTPGKVTVLVKNSENYLAVFDVSLVCDKIGVIDSALTDNFQSGMEKNLTFRFDANVKEKTQDSCILKVTDEGNLQSTEKKVDVTVNPTVICTPNQEYCEGEKRMMCLPDGSKFIELVNDNSCRSTPEVKNDNSLVFIVIILILILAVILLLIRNNKLKKKK